MTRELNYTDEEMLTAMATRMPRHRPTRTKSVSPSVYAITLVSQTHSRHTKLLMSSRKAAFKFIRDNGSGLHECLFTFVVVERIYLDYIPRPFRSDEAYWFVWTYRQEVPEEYETLSAVEQIRFLDDGHYVPIKTPSFCKNRELQASIG